MSVDTDLAASQGARRVCPPALDAPDSSLIPLALSLILAAAVPASAAGATSPSAATQDTAQPDPLHRGTSWDFCGPRPSHLPPPALPPTPDVQTVLTLDADAAEYDRDRDLVTLRGRIQAERGAQRVEAEELIYDRQSGEMSARGKAFLQHPGVRIAGDRAHLNIEQEQGTLWDARYRLTGESNARGTAERAEVVSSELTRYRDITYSTCPPGRNDWSLLAKDLEIDQDRGIGIAHHARLRVGSVPVFYTPYLRFPIDSRRRSGFLVPSIGSSSETGLDLTLPYYLNIAPALDATLFPRYMGKRGPMLGGELRFLTPNQSGEIYAEILPQDQGSDERGTRGAVRIEQRGSFASRWLTRLNFNRVSDRTYLEDFGNRLEVTSLRNIEQRGDLLYLGDGWRFLSRLQAFQTVDEGVEPDERPYARLPQLLFSLDPLRLGSPIELAGDTEYVHFDHETKVRGQRLTTAPYLHWPLRRSYGHLIPTARFYGGAYSLSDQAPEKSSRPAYAIPSLSLDAGLIFERTMHWLGTTALQTIEPRLFYLLTPFEDQSDQPLFDTTELSFSYSSLFRENRFTGPDRIGDANQLTLGLTSRTLALQSGRELLRASLGQILYFDDPEVVISDLPVETRGRTSAIAAEIAARVLKDWTARASLQFEPNPSEEDARWEKRVLQLRYQKGPERLFNAGYQFDQGTTLETRYEDTDVSFRWPIGNQVEVVGRWLYSLLYNETMEAVAGLQYGRCCWRLSLVGRHFKNRPEGNGNTSIMLQLELAGLGRLGHQVDKFLERGIYGYHAD